MFKGSMVALITPMTADGAVDNEALERLVEFHVAGGTSAIVAVGTTGESPTLTLEEHIGVIKRVVQAAKKRVPVIAGTGSNATHEAIEQTKMANEVGADACLLVTPYYNKPTQEGLYQHYKAVARAVAIPQILYNVPGRTGVDLQPETVERLTECANIVGIKEAASLARNRELLNRVGGRMDLISGDDDLACECVLAGYQGVISVSANVAPKQVRAVMDAALARDYAGARKLDAALQGLHKAMFLESNPIPVKWAAARMGLIGPTARLPLTPLASQHHAQVESALRSAGIALA
jgi:4-hydroxy-tetrahydrodipicolinate synthase